MSDDLDGVSVSGALFGINPEDRLLYILQIDKEHHAVYATLIEQDKQALREMVRAELVQVLTLMRDKPEISQVVYQTETKEKAYIELEMGGKTYGGLVHRQDT